MKKNAARSAPLGGEMWNGGAETYINKGTNGRWKDILPKLTVNVMKECAYNI